MLRAESVTALGLVADLCPDPTETWVLVGRAHVLQDGLAPAQQVYGTAQVTAHRA